MLLVLDCLLLVFAFGFFFYFKDKYLGIFEYRFFLLFNILLTLTVGAILAPYFRDANAVLRMVSESNFLLGKLIILGACICYWVIDFAFDNVERKFLSPSAVYCSDHRFYLAQVLALLSLGLVISAYGFPQLRLFADLSAGELAYFRIEKIHNSALVSSLFKNVLGFNLSVLLSYYFFTVYLFHRRRTQLLYFMVFLAASFYFCTLDLSKSKLALYLLGLMAIKFNVYEVTSQKQVSLKYVGLAFFALTVLVLWMFALTIPGVEWVKILEYATQRLLVNQIAAYFAVIELLLNAPDVLDGVDPFYYYFGEQLRLVSFMAPGQFLTSIIYPELFYSGRMNYLSTFNVADLLMIFGFGGLLLMPLIFVVIRLSVLLRRSLADVGLGMPLAVYFLVGSNFTSSALPFFFSVSALLPVLVLLLHLRRIRLNIVADGTSSQPA